MEENEDSIIYDLPPEVWSEIFLNLPISDLKVTSKVCKYFFHIIHHHTAPVILPLRKAAQKIEKWWEIYGGRVCSSSEKVSNILHEQRDLSVPLPLSQDRKWRGFKGGIFPERNVKIQPLSSVRGDRFNISHFPGSGCILKFIRIKSTSKIQNILITANVFEIFQLQPNVKDIAFTPVCGGFPLGGNAVYTSLRIEIDPPLNMANEKEFVIGRYIFLPTNIRREFNYMSGIEFPPFYLTLTSLSPFYGSSELICRCGAFAPFSEAHAQCPARRIVLGI